MPSVLFGFLPYVFFKNMEYSMVFPGFGCFLFVAFQVFVRGSWGSEFFLGFSEVV